jgi:hypothetical protein
MKTKQQNLDDRREAALQKIFPENSMFRFVPADYLTMDIQELEQLAKQKGIGK